MRCQGESQNEAFKRDRTKIYNERDRILIPKLKDSLRELDLEQWKSRWRSGWKHRRA